MLTVFRSNRAEVLVQLLAAQLRLFPPDPFTEVEVIVNTWPTSRWLGEQLAVELGGVCAHVRFPFPAAHLRRIVDTLLAEEPADEGDDPWRADRLVWPLLSLLPEIAERPEGAPLRRWAAGRGPLDRIDPAFWQLGRAIADAFDDYALYRPGMLQAWEEGQCVDGRGRPLPEDRRWQPLLYSRLRRSLPREPHGLRAERLIERLRRGAPLPELPPGPLRLFGVSSLAPLQVRLLQALSGRMDVDVYLLTPCRDLWIRSAERRRRLRDAVALQQPLDGDWMVEAHALEARFGRLGAEFQQLLEGTGEAQLGAVEERDLFFAPAGRSRQTGEPAATPLLAQLQEELADPAAAPPLTRDPGDTSVEFHPCPGRLRQVQIVRDRVLQLMAADPGLEPRDVLVMTPRVEHFAPLVASVFGDVDATGVALPWRVTDRSQQDEAGIGRTVLALLRLAGERFTASALEELLDCPPLQHRFQLEPEETAQLTGTLQRCGLRWGLDGRERGGVATHSLAWVIDRLLLGLVLPERDGLAPAGVAPFSGGGSIELGGRRLHLLLRLRHWLGELRRGGDVEDWRKRLTALLEDLFGDGGEAAWELVALQGALDAWRREAAGFPPTLEAAVVAAVLEEKLSADSGRFGHRSGALTISALEPMRAIPHRVIVLMGLEAGDFPRRRHRPGFHLMERDRCLGDPDPADQDRYVLMEALLSARDHLLVCWSCRDERSGVDLPAAEPVRQWLQWLRMRLGAAAEGLTWTHPVSPLDPANFLAREGRPPLCCDRRLLECRLLLDRGDPLPPTGLIRSSMPEPGELAPPPELDPFEDLSGWLREPQRHWLAQLGLRPGEWEEAVEDLEALELGERQRARLLRRMLDRFPAEEDPPAPREAVEEVLRHLCRGRGELPGGAAGELELARLAERWGTLRQGLDRLGQASRRTVAWGRYRTEIVCRGDALVLLHPARADVSHRMELWLRLLLACAAGDSPPGSAVLVARDNGSADRFVEVLRLNAPRREAACAELERLAGLREEWRGGCWPVPPRTGWSWLEAERNRPGRGRQAASQCWEGGYRAGVQGERSRPEMVVCFGADLPFDALLEGGFAGLGERLYGVLLEAST